MKVNSQNFIVKVNSQNFIVEILIVEILLLEF